MLVLAIASAIIVMGIRQYQLWQIERDYLVLKYNVDVLFQGLKQYYQANCDDQTTGYDIVIKGKLSPSTIPDPINPVKVDIATDIQPMLTSWPRYTSIIDTSIDTGFYAQFNPNTRGIKNAYACWYFGSGSPECNAPTPIQESKIILWQVQVVVKMRDPTKTVAYSGTAGADCVVDTFNPGDAIDCSMGITTPGTSAAYMVWQRLPSFSSSNIRSSHWLSDPMGKILKLQYTHDPMYEMYNEGKTTHQNYLCGG